MNYQKLKVPKNQVLDNKIISQFVQHRRDSDAPHTCFYYHPENSCNETSIISHVVSKSLLRKYISTNNQVYMPDTTFSLKKANGIEYKLTGVNKATTFYGFCQKHDNEIFADIDNDNWQPTEKQIILGFYRSLCFEVLQKARASDGIKNIHDTIAKEMGVNPDDSLSKLLLAAGFQQLGIQDCLPLYKYLQNLIYKHDFKGNMSYASWKTEKRLPIACFGVFAPAYDVRGNAIQDYSSMSISLENILLAIVPTPQSSNITAACIAEHSIAYDFIKTLSQEDEDRISDIAVKLVIINCENHCCNPEWYKNLTTKKKKDVLRLLRQLPPEKIVFRNFPKIIENRAIFIDASADINNSGTPYQFS